MSLIGMAYVAPLPKDKQEGARHPEELRSKPTKLNRSTTQKTYQIYQVKFGENGSESFHKLVHQIADLI